MSKTKITVLILLPRRGAETDHGPARARGIVLYGYTEDGGLSWEMSAAEGTIDNEMEDLSEVMIRFPGEDGTALVISAPSLIRQGGIRRLSGSVRIERGDGFTMTSGSLDWDGDTLSADRVKLSYGKIEASGGGFSYDINEDRSTFSNGVEGRIERGGGISVSGKRAEESDGRIVITGDVVVRSEGETYRCARLESDREGEEVILTGGVTALMSEGRLTGERLVIDPDGIAVSGSVVLDFDLGGENGA